MKNKPGQRQKKWEPTPEQEKLVREKYAEYYSRDTLTKSRICDKFKIGTNVFERWCVRNGVKPKKRNKRVNKDFTGYKRISVPCHRSGPSCQTLILVAPDKDIEEVRRNYMDKYFRNDKETRN